MLEHLSHTFCKMICKITLGLWPYTLLYDNMKIEFLMNGEWMINELYVYEMWENEYGCYGMDKAAK